MTDSTFQLQMLVAAAKMASRPSDADQTRVHAALEARLGKTAFLTNGPTAAGRAIPTAVLKAAAVSAVGVAFLGGAAWLKWGESNTTRPPQEITSSTTESHSVAIRIQSEPAGSMPGSIVEPTQTPSVAPRSVNLSANAGAKIHTGDRLAEEVALISRAQNEISAGRSGNALKLLDEHQRKFPKGLLSEERVAARVQALCALGRTTEASAQLNRLSPNSLHHRGQSDSPCATKADNASSKP